MSEFITFFVIITSALLFSEVFNRLNLPWVTALIVAGIVFGAEGFGVIAPNPITDFFSEVGLVFLMFMAGLEIRLSSLSAVRKEMSVIGLINGLAPFLLALGISFAFGLDLFPTLLLAAALVSSSIAVVLPSLEGSGIFSRKLGHTIIASTTLLEIASVLLFSFVIQQVTDSSTPLIVLYGFLAMSMVLLRLAVPKLEDYFANKESQKFEKEIQLLVSVLMGTVILFGVLGLEPAEAGFFAGLILSDSIQHKIARAKLHAIAYGLFIPVFFVMVGAEINLGVFFESKTAIWLTLSVVIGSMLTKYASGWLAGRLVGFSAVESSLIGVATIPQLNVALAIAATGFAAGVIDLDLLTALVMLSVTTSFVAPPLMKFFVKRVERVDKQS